MNIHPVIFVIASLIASANCQVKRESRQIEARNNDGVRTEAPERSLLYAKHIPGELIVTMNVKVSRDLILGIGDSDELIDSFGCDEYECLSEELIGSRSSLGVNRDVHISYLLRFKDKSDDHLYDSFCRIKRLGSVAAVDPNFVRTRNSVEDPIDERYSEQWGLQAINAPAVWKNYGAGSYGTRIGVLDDGVYPHEDLKIDTNLSRDFVGGPRYGGGHGTHVAGICGAIGDNGKTINGLYKGIGVVGVGQKATVVDLKVANYCWKSDRNDPNGGYYISVSTDSNVIKAVDFATSKWDTSQRISVLNYSYSGYSDTTPDTFNIFGQSFTIKNPMSDSILLSFRSFPGTVVWSAGNDANPLDDNEYRYSPNLISVGSFNGAGLISEFSNWGPAVNIYAPGDDIISTINEAGNYASWSGTSMAAPFVSGVAAYLYSKFPGITARQVKEAIVESVNYEKVIHTGNGVMEPIKKLDFAAAYEKAYDLYNEAGNYPIKLEMLNYLGGKWKILVSNTGRSALNVAYPKSNCSEQDVTKFPSNNCGTFSLSGKSSKVIEIPYNENKGLCFPVGVYSNGIRKITYLYCNTWDHYVQNRFLRFSEDYTSSTVPGTHLSSAPEVGLDFEIKSSRINWFVRDWKITIKNKVSKTVDVMYNSKMCFYDDGLNWKNLSDVQQISLTANGTSSEMWINANGTADAIAMCLVYVDDFGLKRGYVSVANGIGSNGHGTLGHKTISL